MVRILIIEDEPDMRRGLEDNLKFEGYETTVTGNGDEGYRLASRGEHDLIILDLMLPGMDGMEICRRLKTQKIDTPIIMLTARGEESDRVLGLELGADDYITKPFSLRELLARVKAILRRSGEVTRLPAMYRFGNIEVNFERYEAKKNGELLDMTPREFEMLRLFASHEGDIVTREMFLQEVWGYDTAPSTRTVDNFVAKLRQRIEDDPEHPRHIVTVHRMGYKFIP